LRCTRMSHESLGASNQPIPTHRGNRFVVRYTEDEPQVTISDALKSLGPTEMFDNKSPRRAELRVIFEWLSTIQVRIHIWKEGHVQFRHRDNTDSQNMPHGHLAVIQPHEPSMVGVLFSRLPPFRANREATRRSKSEHGDRVRTQG